ncbi:MAG: helix-turn-helix transcriptional regulator [Clostridia bacterium]|nr:helix-turn-helix transcriptional regulator [Clostridia bacterium]
MENNFDISQFIDVETRETVLKNLQSRVRKRRKEKGLTQKELARISGVSYASIRRFENTGDISLSSLMKIAQELESLDDFNELFKNAIISSIKDLKV